MVKEKPNSIRIYDHEGFRRRAACICVRSELENEVNKFLSLPKNHLTHKCGDVWLNQQLSCGTVAQFKLRSMSANVNQCCLVEQLSSSYVINPKLLQVLLVTSSRRPDSWIVPGGGVEPEEEPSVTATREVLEEAGVIGKLGRSLGVFENIEHKHRTEVYVMIVTEELEEWEDSRTMGRKRQWFTINEALEKLALHKPVQRHYLQQLLRSKLT
ncbi:hypothetical protein FQR65_LT10661 [Abscondita terminalis]|nr:hypothetical protein FQR65_LT10661 [Abscondita terminalis]